MQRYELLLHLEICIRKNHERYERMLAKQATREAIPFGKRAATERAAAAARVASRAAKRAAKRTAAAAAALSILAPASASADMDPTPP
jgi:hypothetical protein